jgi:hypothetical protein
MIVCERSEEQKEKGGKESLLIENCCVCMTSIYFNQHLQSY